MFGLRGKVAAFSEDLRRFSQELGDGLGELQRVAASKPCIAREALACCC